MSNCPECQSGGGAVEMPAGIYCKVIKCPHRENGYSVHLTNYGKGYSLCKVNGNLAEEKSELVRELEKIQV